MLVYSTVCDIKDQVLKNFSKTQFLYISRMASKLAMLAKLTDLKGKTFFVKYNVSLGISSFIIYTS